MPNEYVVAGLAILLMAFLTGGAWGRDFAYERVARAEATTKTIYLTCTVVEEKGVEMARHCEETNE